MSNSTFSSSDDVIDRKIIHASNGTSSELIGNVYEIKRCTSWISQRKFMMVALQFPDELLVDAPQATKLLELQNSGVSFFILGDTTYGSCCVDEIGAQHYKADCLIHFGAACLSPVSRLPVLYVFGKSDLDVDDAVSKTSALFENAKDEADAVLVYDTGYQHKLEQVFDKLKCHFSNLVLSELIVGNTTSTSHADMKYEQSDETCGACDSAKDDGSSVIAKCGRIIRLPNGKSIENCKFIFLGNSESPTLINMIMTFNKCLFYTYDPANKTCYQETLNVNKALMKRYYLIERAKDANIVGIIVGTLGVVRYKEMIEHLKTLIRNAGKKSYTFVVGKLNPAKLANFAEIDLYVLVACSESSLLDQHDFYRPVVTPFEMEVACNRAREWTGDYSTDFSDLLPGAAMYINSTAYGCYEEEGDVSLISNRIRIMGVRNTPELTNTAGARAVTVRESLTITNTSENAGEFFGTRSWKGLEQKLGETPVTKASEGQCGIAVSYEHENH